MASLPQGRSCSAGESFKGTFCDLNFYTPQPHQSQVLPPLGTVGEIGDVDTVEVDGSCSNLYTFISTYLFETGLEVY